MRRGDYAMAKHAVMALTKTAAGEHAKDNIQINCVCPGPIDTPLATSVRGASESEGIRPTSTTTL